MFKSFYLWLCGPILSGTIYAMQKIEFLQISTGASPVVHASLSKASDRLIVHTEDGMVRLVSCKTGQSLAMLSSNAQSIDCAQTHDNVAILGVDNHVEVYDVRDGKCVFSTNIHAMAMRLSNSGALLAMRTKRTLIFNGESCQLLYPFELWDVKTGQLLVRLENKYDWSDERPVIMSFDSRDKRFLVGLRRENLVYDVQSGNVLLRERNKLDFFDSFNLSFSRDGLYFMHHQNSSRSFLKVWNIDQPRLVAHVLHGSPILTFDLDTAHNKIVVGCEDGSIYFWDCVTGKQSLMCSGTGHAIDYAKFFYNGVILMTHSADGALTIWNSVTMQPMQQFDCVKSARLNELSHLLFSLNTKNSFGRDRLTIYDICNKKKLGSLGQNGILDSQRLATNQAGTSILAVDRSRKCIYLYTDNRLNARLLAFAAALHKRCGVLSPARVLDQNSLRRISDCVDDRPFACTEQSECSIQ